MKNLLLISFFFTKLLLVAQSNNVQTEILLSENISIRAMILDKNILYFAGSNNQFGKIDLKTKKQTLNKINADTLALEFRSIAQTKSSFFILSISNPALLYKISKKTLVYELVYSDYNSNVFYDCMQFKNNYLGMAIGDPISNFFCILTTIDGGASWKKLSNSKMPLAAVGEAAFAASNSSLVFEGKNTRFASGGTKARVYSTSNYAKSWKVTETPMQQGSPMKGVFSMDFYNHKIGIIAGGDYDNDSETIGCKAITFDGGTSWKAVSNTANFGYTSCIKFIKNAGGKKLIAVAKTGVYISNNFAETWQLLLAEKDLYSVIVVNENDIIVSGKNKILRLKF